MLLMYHKVDLETPTIWWVSADAFDRQMAELSAYDVVPLAEYDPANPKHAAITFDGVYRNVYKFAFPILRKWGYPFELFVIGNYIGKNNRFDKSEPLTKFATLNQLKEMAAHGGRVQWHTKNHKLLKGLTTRSLISELSPPPELSEKFPAPHLQWFAYPHGEHDDRVVEEVSKRFSGALSCIDGDETDHHQWNRITAFEDSHFNSSTVGIVIANYNYGRFLPEAVQSVKNQTQKPDQFLIIDDASEDDSSKMLEFYKDDAEIVINPKNLGIVGNLRKALNLISTDYVAILGADNTLRTDFVELCRAALDRNPEHKIAYTDMSLFGPRASLLAKKVGAKRVGMSQVSGFPIYYWRFGKPTKERLRKLEDVNFIHGSSMYRKSFYDAVGGYRKTGGPEDHDLFKRMLMAGGKAAYVPHDLVRYRQHSETQANTALGLQLEKYQLQKSLTEIGESRKELNEHLVSMTTDRDRLDIELAETAKDRDRLGIQLAETVKDRDTLDIQLAETVKDRDRLSVEYQKLHAIHNAWSFRNLPRMFRRAAGVLVARCPRIIRDPIYRLMNLQSWLPNAPGVSTGYSDAISTLVQSRIRWSKLENKTFPLEPTPPQDWPEIDLTVVMHNSEQWLEGFFASLNDQSYPTSKIGIYAIDNASTDSTVGILKSLKKRCAGDFRVFEIIENENVGYGAGHDEGIQKGNSDFILVTNVDLVFESETICALVATALADCANSACFEARQKPYEHPKYYDPVTGQTSWCSHACVLIKRTAYEAVGRYESALFMYGEDVELSYRFSSEGYGLVYVPRAVVWHYSYEQTEAIKPLQFQGSTLANSLIRLRYGSAKVALAGVMMMVLLPFHRMPYSGARVHAIRNILKLAVKGPRFLLSRRRNKGALAFRMWDYTMIRDGSFYAGEPSSKTLPLVSIIIRTHGPQQNLLSQAIASAVQQTYENIEVIITEDGGSLSAGLIEQLQGQTSVPIRYKPLDKVGRSRAGNVGLMMANGEYFNFLDDDDLLYCDHVETLVNELVEKPEKAAAYSLAWTTETKMAADKSDYHEVMHSVALTHRQEFSYPVLQHHNFIPIQSCLFRRELYEHHGGFNPALDALEDWNLWLRYAHGQTFVHVPKVTSLFREPYDVELREQRKSFLNASYEEARLSSEEAIRLNGPLTLEVADGTLER